MHHPCRLAAGPGLGVTPPGCVGKIPVQNFRDIPGSTFSHQPHQAAQPGQAVHMAGPAENRGPCLTKHRKLPGPCRSIVIRRLSLGVFIPLVFSEIGVGRRIEQLTVVINRAFNLNSSVCQTPDAAGNQQFLTGFKGLYGHLLVLYHPQGEQKQLIGSQGIICHGVSWAPRAVRTEAVGKKPRSSLQNSSRMLV